MGLVVVLTCLIWLSAFCGDFLVKFVEKSQLLKAFADNGTHAVIGGLSWMSVNSFRKVSVTAGDTVWQTVLCTVVASLIDLDHFALAKSMKLQAVTHLESRPFMHNTTFMGLLFAIFYGLSVILSDERLHLFAWMFLTAFFSHHTRDAIRRGYWITPFGSTAPLNHWLYLGVLATTPYLIANLMKLTVIEKQTMSLIDLRDVSDVV